MFTAIVGYPLLINLSDLTFPPVETGQRLNVPCGEVLDNVSQTAFAITLIHPSSPVPLIKSFYKQVGFVKR